MCLLHPMQVKLTQFETYVYLSFKLQLNALTPMNPHDDIMSLIRRRQRNDSTTMLNTCRS